MWVTCLTPRSLFCVSFAVPLSAESLDCRALFLLRQLSLHYQYSIHLSLSSIRSLLFNSLKVSNIFNSIIIYKLPTVVEAKPSGPSCVYCWPSGWLMAKLRELDMRRNGMQNTSLLSKSATCEQKFLLVVVIVMAKLRKTNQMHISSSSHSRSGWWQSFVAQGLAKYLPCLKEYQLQTILVPICRNSGW